MQTRSTEPSATSARWAAVPCRIVTRQLGAGCDASDGWARPAGRSPVGVNDLIKRPCGTRIRPGEDHLAKRPFEREIVPAESSGEHPRAECQRVCFEL